MYRNEISVLCHIILQEDQNGKENIAYNQPRSWENEVKKRTFRGDFQPCFYIVFYQKLGDVLCF